MKSVIVFSFVFLLLFYLVCLVKTASTAANTTLALPTTKNATSRPNNNNNNNATKLFPTMSTLNATEPTAGSTKSRDSINTAGPTKATTATGSPSTTPGNHLQRQLASHVSSNAGVTNISALSYYNYPFHQYALPECATQQVCNAVYTRLDRINALCACPEKFGDPCSIAFTSDDAHTIELVTDNSGKALTLIKTCEPIASVRECRGSKDWSLLALQNVRTGKSHYLVVCRCVHTGVLEGPIAHENPPYAKIPGIRVYGMICIRDGWDRFAKGGGSRGPRDLRKKKPVRRRILPKIPWDLVKDFVQKVGWN